MQLSTIPDTAEIPPRADTEPLRDRSERAGADRSFDRELGEAASRYERADTDSADRSGTPVKETEASSPPDETDEAGEGTVLDPDGQSVGDDAAKGSDPEQADQVETNAAQGDDGVESVADPDEASDALTPGPEELAAEPLTSAQEAPPSIETVMPTGDGDESQGLSTQANPESAAAQVGLATEKSGDKGPGTQGVADRSQATSGKSVNPAAVVATPGADGSGEADTADGGSGGDVTRQKPGGPLLTNTTTTQGASIDTAARPTPLAGAATPIQAVTPGAHAAGPNLAQTLASVTTPETDADPINAARLTRGLQSALQQPGGTVTLRLTPPELGTVRIQLQLSSGSVSASFHAEGASARSMLTQQLSQLRTALESQGLNVERLNVQPMQQTNQSSLQQQNQQSSADGRSRGQYTGQQQQPRDDRSDPDQPSRESFERLMLNEVA